MAITSTTLVKIAKKYVRFATEKRDGGMETCEDIAMTEVDQ
jgi:hypothetical protein